MARLRVPFSWFLVLLAVPVLAADVAHFDLDAVADKAQRLAGESFQDPNIQVPDWLLKITYDQWRDIRFPPDHAPWRDAPPPFQNQVFHPRPHHNPIIRG